jgi:outer membrane biosynthesis protein TonB
MHSSCLGISTCTFAIHAVSPIARSQHDFLDVHVTVAMLARGTTLGRLAAANTSARTLPQLARVLHQALVARNASSFPAVRALSRAYQSACEARRSYATTTAATTPTATVKKAVKAKAASKAAPKKTVAATKAKKTTKTPAKKPAKKTAASKAKPKAKAKKAAPKKPAPKARVKKVLTPEQKAKAKISELRKIALREPVTASTLNAWNVFVAEHLQGKAEDGTSLVKRIPEVAAKFKNLTPADLEVSACFAIEAHR